MEDTALERRVTALEARSWTQQSEIAGLAGRVSSLETSRDNERARHSSTPAWVFGAISAAVAITALLFNLFLAGARP